ncbi:MAG: hypothetical protein CMH36_08840 [Microbacterium sp.]|uniref:hypothetical protein n=1 Tax=Microbacterium sp. 4NA327F11 TaxID=2502229 RepID=UPI000C974CA7|nr:hypothetical protein [Microbacterium sp. 4NA327F11]MAL06917.1 hypothetical protein [Microbacterium sp.]MCK9913763.1 hypothetical protein [Microbacteriaceae bacterium K1510]
MATTRDDRGNLHAPSGTPAGGQFAQKRNSPPAAGLDADVTTGEDITRPLTIRVFREQTPGGYDLAIDAPTGRHYMRDGVHHRTDGPSYEGYDGTVEYYENGLLHRVGKPARTHSDGTSEYWEHGQPQRL